MKLQGNNRDVKYIRHLDLSATMRLANRVPDVDRESRRDLRPTSAGHICFTYTQHPATRLINTMQ